MPTTQIRELSAEDMRRAASGIGGLPVEQSEHWEAFATTQGHSLWGLLGWYEGEKCLAVIALYEHRLRSWRYLWAKNGPVWIKEATPDREAAFRRDLVQWVRKKDRGIVFVRLHAWYSAPELEDVLQTITYDRTVIIDCAKGEREAVLASMPNDGKRSVRRAVKKCEAAGVRIVEETDKARHDFSEYYRVMVETAERDGFRPHASETYSDLLSSLGEEHARLFVARDCEGELLCWDLVLLNAKKAQAEYGASTARSRQMGAPVLLDFELAILLGSEGYTGLDLRGAHSVRVPELFTVGKYKRSFAQSFTDVAGAWDLPVSTGQYQLVRTLVGVKRTLTKPSSSR